MKKVRVFFIYLSQKKRVLLKRKSLSLKTIRVLQRILTIFARSKELSTASQNFLQRAGAGAQLFSREALTFWNQQVYLRRGIKIRKLWEAITQCFMQTKKRG